MRVRPQERLRQLVKVPHVWKNCTIVFVIKTVHWLTSGVIRVTDCKIQICQGAGSVQTLPREIHPQRSKKASSISPRMNGLQKRESLEKEVVSLRFVFWTSPPWTNVYIPRGSETFQGKSARQLLRPHEPLLRCLRNGS